MENDFKLLSEEADKQDYILRKKDEEINAKSIISDLREYDKKVHKNINYWATDDEEDLKKCSKPMPIKPKSSKGPEILIKNEEILNDLKKNEGNMKKTKEVIMKKPIENDIAMKELLKELQFLKTAYEEERNRNEILEQNLLEKDILIEKLTNKTLDKNNEKPEKTQELYEKIKKLKDKIDRNQAEAEEMKRHFLLKSEKDDRYIELLKQELEKLKNPNILVENTKENGLLVKKKTSKY